MEGIDEPESEKQKNANSKEHSKYNSNHSLTYKQSDLITQETQVNPNDLPKTQPPKVFKDQAKHYWTFKVESEQNKENSKNRKKLDCGKNANSGWQQQ